MKTLCRLTSALVLALALLSAALPALAATTDLELLGEAAGLVLTPAGGKLFDLANMAPGESRKGKISIKNSYSSWYDLWISAGEMTGSSPSLLEVLELTVLYGGEELYRGPVQGFASGPIYLGRFHPGEKGEMSLAAHLPGPETGNEYQGKSAGVKWIFTARSGQAEPVETKPRPPGDLPRTYGAGVACTLLGGLALLAGIRFAHRRNR